MDASDVDEALKEERAMRRRLYQLAETQRSLEETEGHLVLLLSHTANSPFRWFFRLRSSFRTLERKYLNTGG